MDNKNANPFELTPLTTARFLPWSIAHVPDDSTQDRKLRIPAQNEVLLERSSDIPLTPSFPHKTISSSSYTLHRDLWILSITTALASKLYSKVDNTFVFFPFVNPFNKISSTARVAQFFKYKNRTLWVGCAYAVWRQI